MPKRRSPPEESHKSKRKRKEQNFKSSAENDDSDVEEDMSNLSQNPDFVPHVKEAEVGIIEKICVKNFMCHSRLDVNLGPHVNYIVGRNGSGKSAVVTALVIGLGGKATITSRGSTIKGFIKSGKQSAEVEVRLRNRGPDAFKHEAYGDTIVVQRKLSADGVSKYLLKSKTGSLVSNKREELAHILDQFNIQVDNPVAILNQETSRNFLNSKSPHDKYKFFLKATQLEQMKHDYAAANEQKAITEEIIAQKERTLPNLEREVLEWEQKFKALDALEELKDKVKKLKHESAWALVHGKEKGLEPILKKLQQEEVRMPKFVSKAEEAKAKLEEYVQKQKKIQEQILAISEEVRQLEPQIRETKKNLQQKKDAVRQAQNEVKKTERDVKSTSRDRDQVLERIKEIKQSAQQDYDADRCARKAKIDSLEESLHLYESQQKTTEHQREQYRSAVAKCKNDSYNLKREDQAVQSNIQQINADIQTLLGSKGNHLRLFGQSIPNILRRIEEFDRRGYFHRTPKGPIGNCFKLRETRWALAIESCLRGLLHAFCCHDHHDEKVLESIFERENKDGRRPSIIVTKFRDQVHNVNKHRVVSNYPAVLDLIEVDDAVIGNILIDQRSIENIILVEDNKEARRLMQHDPPKQCKEAFTLVGDQIYCHPTFRYYSSNIDKAQYLMSNTDEEIATKKMELRRMEMEQEALRQKRQKLNEDMRSNSMEEKHSETQLMKIGEAVTNIKYEISDLKSVEDPAPIDVTTLEEEVENYNKQIKELDQKRNVVIEAFSQQQQQFTDAEAAFRDVERQLKEKTDTADPLKEEDGHALNDIEIAKNHKKHYDGKLKEQEKQITDLKKKVEDYQAEIKSDIEKAKQIWPERIKTRRTSQNLKSEIEQINKRIRTEEKSRGNPEEITRKYKETKDAFMKIKKEVGQLKRFLDHLDKVMIHRQRQYTEFRRLIGLRAKYFFIVLLSNRNYNGKMSFNHAKETLEMSVQPTSTSGEGVKDLKSLSGGERSFSTVCFILALWDAMESPFRCLDEFDVFMDMVNRRISMDMMMEVAKVQTGRQFIFLTPQDMSQLNIGKNFRIFRMPDPDRGQSVLPFGSQEQEVQEA